MRRLVRPIRTRRMRRWAPAERRLQPAPAPAPLPVYSSEGTATEAAPEAAPLITSVAVLLTRHVLRDGELVLLILRPSLWFIPLSSLKFLAGVAIVLIGALLLEPRLPHSHLVYIQFAILVAAARLMWAVLQWTSQLYVLTDMRIVSITGVFNVSIFDCPLRRVARVRLVRPTRERLVRVGSVEIIPQDESMPVGLWQTVPRPRQVYDQIRATIGRAKQGTLGGGY